MGKDYRFYNGLWDEAKLWLTREVKRLWREALGKSPTLSELEEVRDWAAERKAHPDAIKVRCVEERHARQMGYESKASMRRTVRAEFGYPEFQPDRIKPRRGAAGNGRR